MKTNRSKRARAAKPAAIDWAGAQVRSIEYAAGAKVFEQGDPATSVMYIERGVI